MYLIYKLVAWCLINNPRLLDWLLKVAKNRPYKHITNNEGEVYMNRWWLFNPYCDESGKRKRSWIPFSIRFHEIVRPDEDRHLHDHPWNAVSLILRGGYNELVEMEHNNEMLSDYVERRPGDINEIDTGIFHRIVSLDQEKPALTMFITYKYRGTWGFLVNGKKVPWREYLDKYKE